MTEPVLNHPIRKGDEVELTIESLAYGGRGVARIKNLVIFVKNSLPGQRVLALIYRKKQGYAEARPLKVLEQTPHYTEPACDHFLYCGGCLLQNLDYDRQIEQKIAQVEDAFRRLGDITDVKINKIIPADQHYHYRNKMEFTFSNRRWITKNEEKNVDRDFALGLHIPGRYDKVLDIHECHIQQTSGNRILEKARKLARDQGLKPYDVKTNIGFLRHLVIRFGVNTGQLMVNLVTSYDNPELIKPLADGLVAEFPEITSLVNNINTRRADVAYGEFENVLHGSGVIQEKLGNLVFDISANSFFQTNTLQAERLYGQLVKMADFNGDETVWDLYCGTGSISLWVSSKVREVVGFEVVSSALEDAQRNLVNNAIGNCTFVQADLDKYFKRKKGMTDPSPDVVIIDPPRSGCHPSLVETLVGLKAPKIIYVSCNPATQARDAKMLTAGGYLLQKLALVDMFPHTAHMETIALFTLND